MTVEKTNDLCVGWGLLSKATNLFVKKLKLYARTNTR